MNPTRGDRSLTHKGILLVAAVCGAAALTLYVATLAPGVGWQDSAVHQFRILRGMLENPYGLALSHPLHFWLGRAVLALPPSGGGDPAWRLNLLSALCGAAGVGALAGLVAAMTRRAAPAILAALGLGLAHTYWAHSVITETYTLAAALMAAEWCFLWRYTRRGEPSVLLAVFMVNGLHVADHLLGVLPLAAYGLLALERIARRRLHAGWLGVCSLGWVVTASPYLSLVARHGMESGDWWGTLHSALFGVGLGGGGYAREVLNTTVSWPLLKNALLVLGYNYPSLVLPLAAMGMLRRTGQRGVLFRNVMLFQTALIAVFVLRYSIRDQYTFFVPLCAILSLWFGLGADRLLQRFETRSARNIRALALTAVTLAPLVVYSVFPGMAEQRGWLRNQMRDLPYRDEYHHFLQPWRNGDNSAAQYARAVLAQCPERGILMTDLTAGYALAFVQKVESIAPELEIYVVNRNLSRMNQPLMNRESLLQAVRGGTAVLATPSPVIEEWWGEELELVGDGLVRALRPRAR